MDNILSNNRLKAMILNDPSQQRRLGIKKAEEIVTKERVRIKKTIKWESLQE